MEHATLRKIRKYAIDFENYTGVGLDIKYKKIKKGLLGKTTEIWLRIDMRGKNRQVYGRFTEYQTGSYIVEENKFWDYVERDFIVGGMINMSGLDRDKPNKVEQDDTQLILISNIEEKIDALVNYLGCEYKQNSEYSIIKKEE